MKALVSYLSQMKIQNEAAAKLLSVASAFTHIAGTFLKNYLKIKKPPRIQQAKRRREETTDTRNDFVDDGWMRPASATDEQKQFREQYGSSAASAFWEQQQNTHSRVVAAASSSSSTAPTPSGIASSESSAATPSDIGIGDMPVDLQAAAFLRWPRAAAEAAAVAGADGVAGETGVAAFEVGGVAAGASLGYDVDLEALMAEPVGFQMQMEQAAMRGPLEFDWFSWDGQFS